MCKPPEVGQFIGTKSVMYEHTDDVNSDHKAIRNKDEYSEIQVAILGRKVTTMYTLASKPFRGHFIFKVMGGNYF